MRARLGTLAAGAALIAAGAGAASVVAGGGDSGPGQDPGRAQMLEVEAQAAAGPSPAARLAGPRAAKGGKSVRLQYFETDPLTIEPGPTGVVVNGCKRRAPALNGYFFVRNQFDGFGLTEQGSSPAALKRWAFYLRNDTGAPITDVTFGIICLRGG